MLSLFYSKRSGIDFFPHACCNHWQIQLKNGKFTYRNVMTKEKYPHKNPET